jgi:hypothetical protein
MLAEAFSLVDTIFTSTAGNGRIGGDVISYVKYAIAGVYDDEEKKFNALATGF